jgi:far upstream element-binding protein
MLRYVMSSRVEKNPQCANLPSQRQKSGGGGGRGRGQGQGGQHRDYDNPSYGQPSNNNSAPQNVQPGGAAPAAAGGASDPYAAYGGYENYVALWWQSQMAQAQGGAGQAPGTS